MRSPAAHTHAPAPHVGSLDAQENSAPLGAKSVAIGPLGASAAPKTSPAPSPSRRPLQPLDANRLAGSERTGGGASTSALKRKLRAAAASDESARPLKQRAQLLSPVLARDRERERENLAWLDMLVALLERKYGDHAPPLDVDALVAAQLVTRGTVGSSSSSSSAGEGVAPRSSAPHDPPAATAHEAARDEAEREKEARRQRVLRRRAQQVQDASVSSSTCCGCKTGCLKMYCVCFSTRGFCHGSCACDDCRNSRPNKAQRLEAIQSYLANDPRAFSFAATAATTAGFLHLLPQKSSSVVLRGCRCKKSKCLKKYCECYQNGIACTAHCRCVDCSNDPAAARHLHQERREAEARQARAFHAVHVTVTKKPKRNFVQKSIRLAL